ncbi:MAG: aminoglycoside phosphotransferase family protein [Actinomycetota bacterium]|nr:aminoglycoside phosphotransferase family protein [Actinomycetota bacterium]
MRGPSDEDEQAEVLATEGLTRVVRIGDTVRRPVRPFTATIHAYLAHLRSRGFTDAPEPLGYDDEGREVLSYVAGDVPVEPLPDYATTTDVLLTLAAMIRRLHDAAEGWAPPADAVWGSIPGAPPPGVIPLFDRPELVSHQDYCPGNVVFRDGLPAALIDFDLARPTTRVADLVNALYWWAPLLHPRDRAPALAEADVAARARVVADAYRMTAAQRAQVVPVAMRRAHNTHRTMRAAAEADPVFRRWWEEGVKDRMPRAQAWLTGEADRIDSALRR